MISRFGGLRVALVCFVVEGAGLLLVWLASYPLMAEVGAFFRGCRFFTGIPGAGRGGCQSGIRAESGQRAGDVYHLS
ncbi:hypothetical protein OS31_30390 [Dickeya oryzae]